MDRTTSTLDPGVSGTQPAASRSCRRGVRAAARARLLGLALSAALAWLLGGCAVNRHLASTETEPIRVSEEISAARVTLAELRTSRFANGAPMELARAELWVSNLEQRLAANDADDEAAMLTAKVLRAELSAIRSYYARREAETALEAARGQYEERKTGLDALEEDHLRLLESTGEMP